MSSSSSPTFAAYQTSYGAANVKTNEAFAQSLTASAKLPKASQYPNRPTGYTANFRPMVGYSPKMDSSDPYIAAAVSPAQLYLSQTRACYQGEQPSHKATGLDHVLGDIAPSGFVKEIPQTTARFREGQISTVTESRTQYRGGTPATAASGGGGDGRGVPVIDLVSTERQSGFYSNQSHAPKPTKDGQLYSEHHASYRPNQGTGQNGMADTSSASPYAWSNRRRPYFLPDRMADTFGIDSHTVAPAALPSSTHITYRNNTQNSPEPHVRSPRTANIEPSGFTQNTLPYVPPAHYPLDVTRRTPQATWAMVVSQGGQPNQAATGRLRSSRRHHEQQPLAATL